MTRKSPQQDVEAEADDAKLTARETLRALFSTMSSTELAQLLAGSEFADGGSVALLPAPPNPEDGWKDRAAAYGSKYAGRDHWRRFIDIVAATGSLPFAARQIGKSAQRVQDRRERFTEFASAVQEALNFFNSAVLERAAFVRAIDGVVEPVFNKGAIVGYIRRFSDALTVKLLEGNMPDKYKPRTQIDLNQKLTIEGGLPEMPLTAADVPDHAKTIEHEPQKRLENASTGE